MNRRNKILGLLLLVSALDTFALTLGRVRGAALVGRPLDVSIAAQLAPEEAAGTLCVEADVFHADTRQDSSRVRVAVEPGAGQTANIRVTSSVPIDEPMVTIYLKAGCEQKITRRYVLLADVASEPAVPVASNQLPLVSAPAVTAAVAPLQPSSMPSAAPATSATAETVAGASVAQPSGTNLPPPQPVVTMARPQPAPVKSTTPKAPKPVAVTPPTGLPPAPKAAAKPAPQPKTVPKPEPATKPIADEKAQVGRGAGQSRLKLDPLSSLSDRVATLETATPAPSPELQKEIQRVQTLEDSVKALVALAAKNEASMMDMRNRVQQAEAERLPIAWVYALGALVLACLGAIGWLWTRLARGSNGRTERDDWWSGSKGAPLAARGDRGAAAGPSNFAPVQGSGQSAPQTLRRDGPASGFGDGTAATMANQRARPVLREDPESQMDVSLVEMSESNFDNLMQSGQAHSGIRKGPLPRQADAPPTRSQPMEMARSINSDKVFDVRQKADFFVSLGQTDQAVRVLEDQINESGETSPLLYLALLDILHSLGLRQDYHQFKEDFNLLFNSRVPEFTAYGQEGRSLEEYPQVLAHITALWPTRKAQMVIEASIFRDTLDESSKPFDLAAFRDLLLLHAIAQTNARGGVGSSDLAPLAAGLSESAAVRQVAAPLLTVDIPLEARGGLLPMPTPSTSGTDLDLDLNDLVAPSVLPSEPESVSTEFPVITPPPAPQGLVDNNFLSFETNNTVQYSLPKPKV